MFSLTGIAEAMAGVLRGFAPRVSSPDYARGKWVVIFHTNSGPVESAPVDTYAEAVAICDDSSEGLHSIIRKVR